jgi:hypothetical protein
LGVANLRAVQPGERRKKRLTVTQAAKADSHRDLLVALRDRLAQTVENPNTNPVALAALSRQISLISKELSIMDTTSGEDVIAVAAATADEPWSAV